MNPLRVSEELTLETFRRETQHALNRLHVLTCRGERAAVLAELAEIWRKTEAVEAELREETR